MPGYDFCVCFPFCNKLPYTIVSWPLSKNTIASNILVIAAFNNFVTKILNYHIW